MTDLLLPMTVGLWLDYGWIIIHLVCSSGITLQSRISLIFQSRINHSNWYSCLLLSSKWHAHLLLLTAKLSARAWMMHLQALHGMHGIVRVSCLIERWVGIGGFWRQLLGGLWGSLWGERYWRINAVRLRSFLPSKVPRAQKSQRILPATVMDTILHEHITLKRWRCSSGLPM